MDKSVPPVMFHVPLQEPAHFQGLILSTADSPEIVPLTDGGMSDKELDDILADVRVNDLSAAEIEGIEAINIDANTDREIFNPTTCEHNAAIDESDKDLGTAV